MRGGDRWRSPELEKPRSTSSSNLTNFKMQCGRKAWHPRQEQMITGDFILRDYKDDQVGLAMLLFVIFTGSDFVLLRVEL